MRYKIPTWIRNVILWTSLVAAAWTRALMFIPVFEICLFLVNRHIPRGLSEWHVTMVVFTGDFNTQKRTPLAWSMLQGTADGFVDPANAALPGTALSDVFDLWHIDCPALVRTLVRIPMKLSCGVPCHFAVCRFYIALVEVQYFFDCLWKLLLAC